MTEKRMETANHLLFECSLLLPEEVLGRLLEGYIVQIRRIF